MPLKISDPVRLLVCLLILTPALAGAQSYRVGAAHATINPEPGTYLAGYGRDRAATGQWDDLYVKAVYVADGDTALAIVTLDSIGLTRPDILLIQEAAARAVPGLPASHVVVTSTHTHAAPDVVGLWGKYLWSSGRDAVYMRTLTNSTMQAIAAAHAAARSAQVRLASARTPLPWVQNLSEPELLDQTLSVLQFVDAHGDSIATLTNYACHPTVLGPANTHSSADYLSAFYSTLAGAMPGEHLFLQGAIGGWVQPLQGDRSIQRAAEVGESLGQASLQLLARVQPAPFTPLAFRSAEFDVPLENWAFRLLMWLGVLDRPTFDGAMRTSAAVFTIGSARFATHPGETSPHYALETRRLLDAEHTFVMGLAQDAMGYILKPEYFADQAAYPHGEYLISVSAGEAAGPRLMQTLSELLPR